MASRTSEKRDPPVSPIFVGYLFCSKIHRVHAIGLLNEVSRAAWSGLSLAQQALRASSQFGQLAV
jgi:hypothetical protein